MIAHVGGTGGVFGHSSGGALALEGVLHGLPIHRLAIYEMAAVTGENRPHPPADVFTRLTALVDAGDREGATELFLSEQVGVPEPAIAGMRTGQAWPFLTSQAHTLPYDVAISGQGLALRPERLATVSIPALILSGDQTWPWMQTAAKALAAAIPGARHQELPGHDHGILNDLADLQPILTDSFTS